VGAFRANHTRPFSLALRLDLFTRARSRRLIGTQRTGSLGRSGNSQRHLGALACRLDQLRCSSLKPNIATIASATSGTFFLYCLLCTSYYYVIDQGSCLRSDRRLGFISTPTRRESGDPLSVIIKRSISNFQTPTQFHSRRGNEVSTALPFILGELVEARILKI